MQNKYGVNLKRIHYKLSGLEHTQDNKVGPLVATNVMSDKNRLESGSWSNDIWCEFEDDPLNTLF